jgi:hypothetical protein
MPVELTGGWLIQLAQSVRKGLAHASFGHISPVSRHVAGSMKDVANSGAPHEYQFHRRHADTANHLPLDDGL